MHDVDVLVVGAGPSGLMLACSLVAHGVSVCLIEKRAARSAESRALAVQPRSLESLAMLGVADAFVAEGAEVPGFQLVHREKVLVRAAFPRFDSPFSKPLLLRQTHTEALLEEHLSSLGARVERERLLEDARVEDDTVVCTVAHGERREVVRARFLCACDGAKSTVRDIFGVAFTGSTYPNDFIQVDCRLSWDLPSDLGTGFLLEDGVIAGLPIGDSVFRFIVVRTTPREREGVPALSEFQALLDGVLGAGRAQLSDVEWAAHFKLHERIAERFIIHDRVFLVGDAAHVHTPAGGQGMNTGLQEAHNLAWKIARVCRGQASARLLQTYESERRPVAEGILKFTDRLFNVALGQRRALLKLRPVLAPLVFSQKWILRRAFYRVSQLGISLAPNAILQKARWGELAVGARMPNLDGLHAHLAHPGHTLVRFNDGPMLETSDLDAREHKVDRPGDRTMVVRPDGVIGDIARTVADLEAYVARVSQ